MWLMITIIGCYPVPLEEVYVFNWIPTQSEYYQIADLNQYCIWDNSINLSKNRLTSNH